MFGNEEVAVVGDPTNVGGHILEGAAIFDIDGAPVAIQGSAVMCGICGPTKIAKGSSLVYVLGMPVALHGDPLLCGHLIDVRGRKRVTSSADSAGQAGSQGSNHHTGDRVPRNETGIEMASGFDQRIRVSYPDGAPYAGVAFVKAVQGRRPLRASLPAMVRPSLLSLLRQASSSTV
jgi:uncharacterized Zn-binding protein involved in type VI secretion